MVTPEQTIIDRCANLVDRAAACLADPDPRSKCTLVAALHEQSSVTLGSAPPDVAVGRPSKPALVHPRDLPRRQLGSAIGHAAFIHAICHIEFTAINLALDAVVRFTGLPAEFYTDWVGVAAEEALHFSLLATHLQSLGYAYGDFDAHDGLWDMAERTGDDVLRRMALVPRVMEARGLDVTPGMIVRLRAIEDEDGARILERILNDEIEHVRIGSRWFAYACDQRELDPVTTFQEIVGAELGAIRSDSLNRGARLAAGFSSAELDSLSKSTDNR